MHPPITLPRDRAAPRCGQRSTNACGAPSGPRNNTIDVPEIVRPSGAPGRSSSANATGVQTFAKSSNKVVTRARLFLVELRERFLREAERVDGSGNAGVDRDLHQGLADLFLRRAVADRTLGVHLELVRAIQRR